MNIRKTTESLEDEESIMSNSSSKYVCVNDFLADEKTCQMIKTLGIDSYSVRKIIENYAGHLQVPTDWKHYKPPEEKKRARESAPIVEFSLEPTQENIKKKRKEEEHLKRRLKKPERNLGVIKSNVPVLKDLMEARTVDNEVVMLDRETSEFVEGRVRGNETSKPMTPIYCGETFLY